MTSGLRNRSRVETAVERGNRQWLLTAYLKLRGLVSRHRLLAAILAAGFLLRIVLIFWATPMGGHAGPRSGSGPLFSYHYDENKVYDTVAAFPQVWLDTDRPYPTYGTSIQYAVGTLLLPARIVLTKGIRRGNLYPLASWLALRFTSVLLGTGAILLTFLLARRVFDQSSALLAAGLLCVSPYHCINSPLATLDVSMSFMLLATILASLRSLETQGWSDFILLGVAFGCLVGMKVVGVLAAAVPLILWSARSLAERPGATFVGHSRRMPRGLLLSAGVASLTYAVTNPHVVFNFQRFQRVMWREQRDWVERLDATLTDALGNYSSGVVEALGFPVALLAAGGLLFARCRPVAFKAAIAILLLSYFAFWRGFFMPRYAIAIAPLLCLFAAAFCTSALRHSAQKPVWTAVAGVLAYSGWLCGTGMAARLYDTRPQAAEYIAGHIPAGAEIGVVVSSAEYPWSFHAWKYPWIDFDRTFRDVPFLERPEYVVVSSLDLEPIAAALADGKVSADYKLDPRYRREWYRFSPPSPEIFRFVDELVEGKSGYQLVRTFSPVIDAAIENPSPEVRIYRRASPRAEAELVRAGSDRSANGEDERESEGQQLQRDGPLARIDAR